MTTSESRQEISRLLREIAEGLRNTEGHTYDLETAFEEAGQRQLAARLAEGVGEWLEAWTTHCGAAIEQALDAIDEKEGQP